MTTDIPVSRPGLSRGPLTGIRVLELGGIGPGPYAGMLLGDLGAEIIRLDRPEYAGKRSIQPVLHRNRRSIAVDLKSPEGIEVVRTLADSADALIEGFRPGVAERLGLGPGELLARNPRLVYGRMTGYGQDGPMAQEPGHDINYIALSGALHAIGTADEPVVPLNVAGDMGGGGVFLALGVVSAVLSARATGEGQVVDAAMTDGSASLLAMVYGFMAQGTWRDERAANPIDGAAPWYAVYRCSDGRHMSVGAAEPQFYAGMLRVLGLADDPDFARQHDRSAWPAMRKRLTAVFATRTRDEWAAAFHGRDTCAAPVLSLREAPLHPHNTARGTFRTGAHGGPEPAPAPRFSGTPAAEPAPAPAVGADTADVLAAGGFDSARIAELFRRRVVG
ncbi:CaiB/BaiF CoA transferase family protein [Streptomyces sp. NPDC055078]